MFGSNDLSACYHEDSPNGRITHAIEAQYDRHRTGAIDLKVAPWIAQALRGDVPDQPVRCSIPGGTMSAESDAWKPAMANVTPSTKNGR